MTANKGLHSCYWTGMMINANNGFLDSVFGLGWLSRYSLLCYPLHVLLAPAVGSLALPLTPGGSGFSVRARVIVSHPFFHRTLQRTVLSSCTRTLLRLAVFSLVDGSWQCLTPDLMRC